MIEEELIYKIDADVAGFIANTENAKRSADGVKEALSKGTRELTKAEVAALAAAEATKKINKAAVDSATAAERMRRQLEMAKVPAAGLVQSVGGIASGLLGVVGKIGMVVSGFRELKKLSDDIDRTIADWDIPEWLVSTPGSRIRNAQNRATMQQNASFATADATLTLGAAARDRAAGRAELARIGNDVTAGTRGFRNAPGLAGVIAGNVADQNFVGSDFLQRRRGGARSESGSIFDELGNDLFGTGGVGTSLGIAASDLAAGFRGATSGFDASSTAGALFGGATGGTGHEVQWADEGAKVSEFTKTLQDNTTAAGAAFSALSGGIVAAVDAAITGSSSASQAFARAAQAAIRSTAAQAVVKAAWEGAEAIGSLAIGDAKGAATHGLAALKYAGIAALAGVTSAGLGSGGGSGGASVVGAGSGAATFSGGGISFGGDASRVSTPAGGGGVTVIVQGATFLDAAAMGAAVQSGIDKARRQGRIRDGESQVSRTE